MVYSNRFVMSVLVNGQIQKELPNGVVPIPFGAEYVLRFRNKNNRRAVVKFYIDGDNVSDKGYIISSHSHVDIKRHAHKDVAFKFVALDSEEAHDHGKNGENLDGTKGVIEARFYLEKPAPTVAQWSNPADFWPELKNPYVPQQTYTTSSVTGLGNIPDMIFCSAPPLDSMPCSFGVPESIPLIIPPDLPRAKRDRTLQKNLLEGCTVEGKASGQTFRTENIELESDYVGLRVVLKGFTPELPIVQTAVEIGYCTQCGAKKSRKTDNFCGQCGTKYQ